MIETLGTRIGRLRKTRGLKQEELAEKLQVSPQAVSKWENDLNCPDISLLPKLAEILGITVDELLSNKSPEDKDKVQFLPKEQRKDLKDMMLRVIVDSTDGDKVRINLPLTLAEALLDAGTGMQINGSDALKNIDLRKIVELVKQGAVGNLVEVDSADGDKVRIFVE